MLLLALSCHKPALTNTTTYGETCGWHPLSAATSNDLIRIDAEPRRVAGITLEVREVGVWHDGQRIDGVQQRLIEEREYAAELASRLDEAPAGLALAITRSASMGQVEDILEAAWGAGFSSVRLVGLSTQPPDLPPPPRPAYAESLRQELSETGVELHQALLAQKLTRQVGRCRPAKNVFAAVAHASPEMKCVLLWHGMDQALKRCPGAAAGRAVTLLYVMTVPQAFSTWVQVELDPSGERWPVDRADTWGALGPEFITRGTVWLDAGRREGVSPFPRD